MGRSQELKFRKMLLTEGVLSVVDFSTGTNSLHLTRTQTRPFHLLSFYLLFSIIRSLFFFMLLSYWFGRLCFLFSLSLDSATNQYLERERSDP